MVFRHLLLLTVVLLVSCNALSEATKSAPSPRAFVTERASANIARLLRVSGTVDEDDDLDDDDTEERAPNLSSLEKAISKVTTKFNSAATSAKVKFSGMGGKSVDDLKKVLGMENLDDVAFTQAKNYKLYDKLVTAEIPSWSKKDLSPEQVRVILGIDKMADHVMYANPNFGYYQTFVETQIPIWVKTDVSPSDVWKKLDLGRLRGNPGNFQIYPSYHLYKNFMINQVESWATKMLSKEAVKLKMGLENLHGKEKKISTMWFKSYADNVDMYRENGWYKQKLSSYDLWVHLGLSKIPAAERGNSNQYKMYRGYILKLDRKVQQMRPRKADVSNGISKGATADEISTKIKIWVDTGKTEDYVKYVLGLNRLEITKLEKHKNYKYLQEYIKDRDIQKKINDEIL